MKEVILIAHVGAMIGFSWPPFGAFPTGKVGRIELPPQSTK